MLKREMKNATGPVLTEPIVEVGRQKQQAISI